jgi:FdhD protein
MNCAALDMALDGARLAPVVRWRDGLRSETEDWLTEEVPVALEFNGISHAVMLATPADLEDFALGFGLSEGIFASAADLHGCELTHSPQGITVHMDVSARSFAGLKERRRTLVGRTGCGVCGTESLAQVLRPVPAVTASAPVRAGAVARAMCEMRTHQALCDATGAVHAAAWCAADGAVRIVREDVGRHNALDKLIGAMATAAVRRGEGFIAVTSRASVEMVQKAAVAGASMLAAISAPTLLAVDSARAAGMCLVGLARQGNLVAYAHAGRVVLD